jgi:hypothetical protein
MADETNSEAVAAETPSREGIPDPIGRRRSPNIQGIETVMGDGRTWILARLGLSPALDEVRDRLYEDLALDEEVKLADLSMVCYCALQANYVLSDPEALTLIHVTAPETVVDSLLECVIPAAFYGDRSFTHWARSALFINGISPSTIPAADLPHVLHHLVTANRAIPLSRFTGVGQHVAMRNYLRKMIVDQKREQEMMGAGIMVAAPGQPATPG